MAADAAEALPRAGRGRPRDPLRRRGAGQRLAAAAVHPADRALHPRPRPGAARARLVRLGLRGDRVGRARGPVPRGARDHGPAGCPQARRACRDRLPLPAVDGLHRLLARRRAPGERDRRARGRRRDAGGRDRGRRPAARAADADGPARARDRDDRRADTVEVPAEARASEGAGAAGWEPTFLAAARVSAGEREPGRRRADAGRRRPRRRGLPPADHHASPLQGRRRRPGALRLDARRRQSLAADRDRRRPPPARAATASPRRSSATSTPSRAPSPTARPRSARPGQHGARHRGALARAISRFEAGLERNVVLEALNDYLLALRFLLEGGGPADLGLLDAGRGAVRRARAARRDQGGRRPSAWRSSASCGAASPPIPDGAEGAPTPAEIGGGDRGPDPRDPQGRRLRPPGHRPARRPPTRSCSPTGSPSARARPSSVAAPRNGTCRTSDERRPGRAGRRPGAEPDDDDSEEEQDDLEEDVEVAPTAAQATRREPAAEEPVRPDGDSSGWTSPTSGRRDARSATTTMRCRSPSPRVESRSSHAPSRRRSTCSRAASPGAKSRQTTAIEAARADPRAASTSFSTTRPQEREQIADRVAYLFPRPETTEWDVREMSYDRRRRAEPHNELQTS